MSYKTILAILDKVNTSTATTTVAFDIANRFDAHVIGFHAEIITAVPYVAPLGIPDPVSVDALQQAIASESNTIEKNFRSQAENVKVSSEWCSITSIGYTMSSDMEHARCVDLIIASYNSVSTPNGISADLEKLVQESGRPVLLIPETYLAPKAFERITIAWNGSKEVARAVFEALPFLKKAKEVEIFTVQSSDARERLSTSALELAATLLRHDVPVKVASVEANETTSQMIEDHLSHNAFDLLIMGASPHSRFWQTLFGGTTRTLLDITTIPVLLAY